MTHGLPILQLADRHVPIEASVTVVAGPLDHDDVIELQAPADLERELGEVPLDLRDEPARPHDLAHLRPLARDVLGQGYAEDVRHPRRAVGLLGFAFIRITFLPCRFARVVGGPCEAQRFFQSRKTASSSSRTAGARSCSPSTPTTRTVSRICST